MKANWSFIDTIELLTIKKYVPICRVGHSMAQKQAGAKDVSLWSILLILLLEIQEHGGVFCDRIPRFGRSKHRRRKYNVTTGSTHTRPFRGEGWEADTFDII